MKRKYLKKFGYNALTEMEVFAFKISFMVTQYLIQTLSACVAYTELLCVSCPSATEFSVILFLLFARSSSNSPRSCQRFRRTKLVPNFMQIRQRVKNYNVVESGQFLQWGSMGKFFICCRIQLKFGTRVCQKPSNDRGEFELDRARSKNNIAENSVALGYETHNTYTMLIVPIFFIDCINKRKYLCVYWLYM